ncbi:hypothetical protein ACNAPO_25465, partial [Escherichia coli]|uniref:hypothetical protein n=1 Tax=Escherichia coli TaxID=562 RepID=UPI003A4E28B3
ILLRQKQKKLIMLPSETMIWQPEFTDKTLSRKPGAVQAQAVIGVGVMVDFISRIMSVLADSWGCWCGLPIDEKTSNYLAYYL